MACNILIVMLHLQASARTKVGKGRRKGFMLECVMLIQCLKSKQCILISATSLPCQFDMEGSSSSVRPGKRSGGTSFSCEIYIQGSSP